jgi:hypothetical protein
MQLHPATKTVYVRVSGKISCRLILDTGCWMADSIHNGSEYQVSSIQHPVSFFKANIVNNQFLV